MRKLSLFCILCSLAFVLSCEKAEENGKSGSIIGVWDSSKVEGYKDGTLVRTLNHPSIIWGFCENGDLHTFDIDLSSQNWKSNGKVSYEKLFYTKDEGAIYIDGFLPMIIKKLTKDELQLEESNVISAFSDCDKMVVTMKKRTGTEDYSKKISGKKWTPYCEETYDATGKLIESYEYDEFSESWIFEDGKMNYYDDDEFDYSIDFEITSGCIVLYIRDGQNEAFKISKLTDKELWFDSYEGEELERVKARR